MNLKKRLTALLLALIMLVSVSSCSKGNNNTSGDGPDRRAEEAVSAAEADKSPVIWSDTTTVTASMYTYFFNAYYKSFVSKYGDYIETMGLDTKKALSEQKLKDDNGERTWYEYIMVQCYGEITETMALADAAKAAGMELSDEDLEIVMSALNEYDTAAEKVDMTADAYIASLFGEKVNRATLEKCLRLQRMAAVYYKSVADSEPMTEEDCQKYFEDNKNDFLYCDIINITVPAEDAPTLTACTDDTQFMAAMRNIIAKNNFGGDYEKYKDTIDSLAANKVYKRVTYEEDIEVLKWAFSDERKAYDIFTKDSESRDDDIDVYMLLPTEEAGRISEVLYRDIEPVRNVYYILRDNAADAQRIYNDWKNSDDAGEEGFKALTEKYSGGTSSNINRGSYHEDLSSWIFSPDVKAGDSTVLTIEGTGTYLLYMLENGDPAWMVDVRSSMSAEKIEKITEELLKEFPSEYSAAIYNTEQAGIS